jgi:pimeloyl-ACP methyl ester carboxylesterase
LSETGAPAERHVQIPLGGTCRVWEKGDGEPLAIFAGGAGYQRWSPFLELVSQSRKVVLISQPGYPGSNPGHHELDDTTDWITMGLDLLEAAAVKGADLLGESAGGMLAAELAAFSENHIRRLVLVGAAGLYDPAEPFQNPFAVRANEIAPLVSNNLEAFNAVHAAPQDDEDETADFELVAYRAVESCARLIWPLGDRGLAKRLHRITSPTLLLWGSDDRVVPASYAKRFADGIGAPCEIQSIEGAGHTVTIDAPQQAAEAVLRFLA